MRFDLYNLDPSEFENLTQALTIANVGPFVTLFGPGPDGGREATFGNPGSIEGATTNDWQGLGVLQAKYKEMQASPREEATWLISEIRKEFKRWRESTKRTEKPKFILFATNVTLSPVPRTGGVDRVAKVMNEECQRLNIEGWAVWHAENINRFLEIHDGIRTSYSAWILPGDILTQLYKELHGDRTAVPNAMRSFLARELVKDRYANLDQAGAADDRTIPLASVFVDLPIGMRHKNGQEYEAGCLQTLISVCDVKHSSEEFDTLEERRDFAASNRMVLVGGPGQGKSTVSQFICQLYRALLVKDTGAMRNADVRSTVTQVTEQAKKENLAPKARRWPIKIPLTRLADQLAKGKCKNLLDYIGQRVGESCSVDVTPADVKEWLSSFPWLIILDGLDEVPGSSNRTQVLEQINNFLIDADECNADLVLVATTRPQGYTDEFSPKHFTHYALNPLTTSNALSYGLKLAHARYGASADRVPILMSRLEQAAAEPSTAHLMTTPLQVTIMAVLLDRVGKAPKDRYTLFADYYRVIYERELEKEGNASNLLRDHAGDINFIHADVGLLLQTRSERSGETESRLTLDELNVIIKERLAEEGHAGDRLSNLTDAISTAATDRLVFLVPSRGGEVSFEIRSLQEFWAADALMNCGEEHIAARLREMSVSSHWRNVLLFALGNIFAHRRTLRDNVIFLVSELNTISESFGALQRRALTGSRLAVEILNDGMVRAPRYERTLVEQALKLLTLPVSQHVRLLAASISEQGMEIVREFLATEIHENRIPERAVLDFLGTRASLGDEWAREKLELIYVGASPEVQLKVFEAGVSLDNWAIINLASRCMEYPENTVSAALSGGGLSNWRYVSPQAKPFPSAPWAFSVLQFFSRKDAEPVSLHLAGRVRLSVIPVDYRADALNEAIADGFPESHWLHHVYMFGMHPSSESLGAVVRAIAPYKEHFTVNAATYFPWIIWYALQFCSDVGDASQASDLISAGALGDVSDWRALERSWKAEQLAILGNGFEDWRVERKPFLPVAAATLTSIGIRRGAMQTLAPKISELANLVANIPDLLARRKLARFFMAAMAHPIYEESEHFPLTPQQVRELYRDVESRRHFASLNWIRSAPLDDEWLTVIDEIARAYMMGRVWCPDAPDVLAEKWASDFARWPGLGSLVICDPSREKPEPLKRRINLEWEMIRLLGSADSRHKRAMAIARSFSRCAETVEEAEEILSHLIEAINLREIEYGEVIRQIALDHLPPSQTLLLGLMDACADSLMPYEKEASYERIIAVQSSALTHISFESMRPC
ncbi:NACHT domain-containing protein [Streptomyces cyaneus]|uniref:NACHT domain-containing protein n=1 Tax=Streptomyces cyaneus TaxID=1904 RepID=UPI000FF89289|nr:hypothetical protein [Streptomyces cyaneus]